MNIVHVVEPFAAGIATFVKSLTETLSHDHHIIIHGERKPVMSAEEVKKSFPKNNVQFIKWHHAQRSINPFKDLFAIGELYRIVNTLKNEGAIDAVHLHSSKSGILGRAACKMAGISNVVYTPNGASFLAGKNRIINFIYKQLEIIANGFGGQVICCSKSEYNVFRKIGINAYYVNNGVNVSYSDPMIIKAPGKFRIVTTGRIVPQKNPHLFNSIAKYFEADNMFEFIWIGEGNEKDRKILASSNINITGWLPPSQVKSIVASADVYMSTSVYEGLSFGVLEALELHKPVLLTDCIGNKDIIKGGTNGNYFNSKSEAILKIIQYYNNQDMLAIMGKYSREHCAENFNQSVNYSTYRSIYSKNIKTKTLELLQLNQNMVA